MPFVRSRFPKYNQAAKVVARFGGPAHLARVLGCNRSTVYKWLMPRGAHPGGTDGVIPTRALLRIRDIARAEGVHLTDADLALTLYSSESED